MAEDRASSRTWRFGVTLRWENSNRGTLTTGGKTPLPVAPPPEFRGPEGLWSPEDLLVASVNSCIMTTFLHYVSRERIALSEYESDAEGTVVFEGGSLRFQKIVVRPKVQVASEEDRKKAAAALEETERKCLVSNSLRARVDVQPQIEVSTADQ
jgi:peroxiredoxin-like protein